MSDAKVLQDHVDKLSTGDLDGAVAAYSDDAVLHYPGQNPLSGEYRGPEEVKSFFTKVGELTGGHLPRRL